MDDRDYWLKEDGELWKNVTRSEFTYAERRAGYKPKVGGSPVATPGFSKGTVEGRITYPDTNPSAYADWDPAFAKILEAHQAVAA
ncbi:MAG: hypothetical protein V4686_01485 [Patescibacteria group bacterium]